MAISPAVVHLVPINHSAIDILNDSSVSGTTVKDALNTLSAASGVTSVSNVDGTITISPNTGAVIASLNLNTANTWLATQTFPNVINSALTSGRVTFAGASGLLSDNAGLAYNTATTLLTVQTGLTISGGTLNTEGLNVTGRIITTRIDGIVSGTAGSLISFLCGFGFTVTSGNGTAGSGGAITLTAGAGGTNSSVGGSGDAGVGGAVNITAGAAGDVSSSSISTKNAGGVTITSGAGGARTNTSATSSGGNFNFTAGAANTSTKNTGSGSYQGSTGGNFTVASGSGGLSTNTVGDGTGGNAGNVTFNGGTAGTGRVASTFNATGGNGSSIAFNAGPGGSATRSTAGQTPNSSTGGVGGNITLAAGAGGDATFGTTNTSGNGGSITMNPGAAGGSGTGGVAGHISLCTTVGFVGVGIVAPGFLLDVNGPVNTPGTTGNTYRWNAAATAPATSVGVAIVNFYGTAATNFLATPNAWGLININGTDYKIPAYT